MSSSANPIRNFLEFYKKAEKLKITMRHSWMSDSSRQESTAEHSWMLGVLVLVLASELSTKIDQLRTLKMVIVHDLAEALTGDIPAFEISARQNGKHDTEKRALSEIVASLPKETAEEIIGLWEEFEACKTLEARFAQSVDKIEVLMQHNLADISTWDQGDFTIGPYYKDHFFNFDPFMRSFKDLVDRETMEKVIKAKQAHKVLPNHLRTYNDQRKRK